MLGQTTLFDVFCIIGTGVLAVGDLMNPQKLSHMRCTKSCLCNNKITYLVLIKFCTMIGTPDVNTDANFLQ